jgi:hypothetical protein
VGPRADLDVVVVEKNSHLLTGLEPPIIQPLAQHYTTELSRLNITGLKWMIISILTSLVYLVQHLQHFAGEDTNI